MTLAAGMVRLTRAWSNLIDKEYGVLPGFPRTARSSSTSRASLRDQINNAGVGDTTGGTTGFDALNTGRQAWSQAMKMGDLERIQERAALTDNPATSIKTQVRNLITNQSKITGLHAGRSGRTRLDAAANRTAHWAACFMCSVAGSCR